MSWEFCKTNNCSYKSSDCGYISDDWGRHESSPCSLCVKDKKTQRETRDRQISKEQNRCINCVRKDSWGEHSSGGKYFDLGWCNNCQIKTNEIIKRKYNLAGFNNSDFQSNKYFVNIYNSENKNNRGTNKQRFQNFCNEYLQDLREKHKV